VNQIFKEEAASERYKGILGASEDPLVSSDIIRDSRASIVDLGITQVVNGDLVKVMSWYDNEWGLHQPDGQGSRGDRQFIKDNRLAVRFVSFRLRGL